MYFISRALWHVLIRVFEHAVLSQSLLSLPHSSTVMSAKIDVPAPFSPLVKLDLPSPEEYNKRKVALISGELQIYTGRFVDRTHLPSRLRYHWPGRIVPVSRISICARMLCRPSEAAVVVYTAVA